VTAIL